MTFEWSKDGRASTTTPPVIAPPLAVGPLLAFGPLRATTRSSRTVGVDAAATERDTDVINEAAPVTSQTTSVPRPEPHAKDTSSRLASSAGTLTGSYRAHVCHERDSRSTAVGRWIVVLLNSMSGGGLSGRATVRMEALSGRNSSNGSRCAGGVSLFLVPEPRHSAPEPASGHWQSPFHENWALCGRLAGSRAQRHG